MPIVFRRNHKQYCRQTLVPRESRTHVVPSSQAKEKSHEASLAVLQSDGPKLLTQRWHRLIPVLHRRSLLISVSPRTAYVFRRLIWRRTALLKFNVGNLFPVSTTLTTPTWCKSGRRELRVTWNVQTHNGVLDAPKLDPLTTSSLSIRSAWRCESFHSKAATIVRSANKVLSMSTSEPADASRMRCGREADLEYDEVRYRTLSQGMCPPPERLVHGPAAVQHIMLRVRIRIRVIRLPAGETGRHVSMSPRMSLGSAITVLHLSMRALR